MILNINETVEVQLTDAGRKFREEDHYRFWRETGWNRPPMYVPKVETDGWSRWQLHELMNIFGPLLHVGNPNLPFKPEIRFVEPKDKG